MSDNLTIFGNVYEGVNTLTFTDTNNQSKVYINTADANATAEDIISGKTAYVQGNKVTGTGNGGGSNGVYVGTGDPDASIGSNGNYYYKRVLAGAYGYTSEPNNTSQQLQVGYEFIANEAIAIIGLRANNTNENGTLSLLLAQLDGTILGQIDNVPVNGNWTTAYFDAPIQLTAGEHYIVQAIRSSGLGFRCRNKSSIVFDSKITGVQGCYGDLPGTADPNNIYSADIIIAKTDNIYAVLKQYYKSSGSWEQIG